MVQPLNTLDEGQTPNEAVSRHLLNAAELSPAILEQALGEICSHQVDFADIYMQYARSESWQIDEGIVKIGTFNIDQGMGIRAVSQDKTAFAYSDDLSAKALFDASHSVRMIAAQGQTRTVQSKPASRNQNKVLYTDHDPIASLASAEKVEKLQFLENYARQRDPRVKQVTVNLSGEWEVVLIARSDGELCHDIRPLIRCNINVIVEQHGRRESGSSGGGGRHDYSYFTNERLQNYAEEAVNRALIALQADPAPAGEMTVVLGSGWPGILLHEAIGHGLEGDFNRKGSSAFSHKLGQRVASKGVTVVDNGTISNRRGSLNIDDEGNQTHCTVLIEDGILRNYMQDELNARLSNSALTGNGRRESYAHLPMPRMTNTYMLAGSEPPEAIIASVDKGLYAVNFDGGQVDITSGKFVFSTSEAYVIEGGKIQRPVKGATLIGNGPDVLTRVSMVGNDLALDSGIGTCGKDGQLVPVGVGQPTLRINGITVGGTQT